MCPDVLFDSNGEEAADLSYEHARPPNGDADFERQVGLLVAVGKPSPDEAGDETNKSGKQ